MAKTNNNIVYYGTGRRKSSIARVRLSRRFWKNYYKW